MRVTTFMSFEASSSVSPKAVAPSATPWTGAWLFSRASKSLAEIRFGNSMSSMSSSLGEEGECPLRQSLSDKDFLLVGRHRPYLHEFLARPSQYDAGRLV